MSNRSWWRLLFTDHPRLKSKDRDAFTSANSGKAKIYCSKCLEKDIAAEEALDIEKAVPYPRPRETIIEQLFGTTTGNDHRWVAGRTEQACQHLRRCTWQSPATQLAALQELKDQGLIKSDVTGPIAATPSILSATQQHIDPVLQDPLHSAYPTLHRSNSEPDFHAYTFDTENPSSNHSTASYATLNPSDSISNLGLGVAPLARARKRPRPSGSRHVSVDLTQAAPLVTVWTEDLQEQLDVRILRMIASAGIPLSFVENPEFIQFIAQYLPSGARAPSRYRLTSRTMPTVIKRLKDDIILAVKGSFGTAQCDGWTGDNHHHYIAFMVNVEAKIYTHSVVDTSLERKTAEILYQHMLDCIRGLKSKWGLTIIAFTTDASGESRKARQLLLKDHPYLVAPDCFAHQVNLLVGDMFKVDGPLKAYCEMAVELITFLRSKTLALAAIRDIQKQSKGPTSVLRAVLTRWTSHYLAFRRLLELKNALTILVSQEKIALGAKDTARLRLVIGNTAAKGRAQKMMDIIDDPLLWHSLTRMKVCLEPLARAANVAQAASCRLDQVLLTFGSLFIHFSKLLRTLPPSDDSYAPIQAILASLETRWAKCDQLPYIASVLLHPLIKKAPFNLHLEFLTIAGAYSLFKTLYERFFHETPTIDLLQSVQDYFSARANSAMFQNLQVMAELLEKSATEQGVPLDPKNIWKTIVNDLEKLPPLIRLAFYLPAICANSASCERLFSVFGNTLTKLRNRLKTQTLVSLAELKMHIRDEHMRSSESKARMRQRFFGRKALESQPASAPPTLTPTATPPSNQSDAETPSEHLSEDFGEVFQHAVDLVHDDEDEDGEIRGKWTLRDLFNVDTDHWVTHIQRTASRSFEEELELYELLDMDAQGVEDDSQHDETLTSVLLP
ncbi:hypothetical protein ONZ45_g7358 [Pleurotus djamor]|nr:hypothetical protein ONZ45_g7358 [Pleurotus djamor]